MYYPYSATRPSTITPSFDAAAPAADPFIDVASVAMPVSVPAMLRHAEWMAVTNETFREALNRVAAYFVTDVEVKGELGEDERDNQKEYLEKEMRIVSNLVEATLSRLVYGNQYTSVIQPITRYLVCPKCSTQYRAADAVNDKKFKFRWNPGFFGKCQSCQYDGEFSGGPDGGPLDLPDESRAPIFRSWNPHDIRPVYNESLGQTVAYQWIIPADFRAEVKAGHSVNKSVLVETPWPHLVAAMKDMNVEFSSDYVHHWREPSLAGLRFRGIGVPRAIINYRQLYHCQILKRMNEVLALGHVVPIRVVSPMPGPGRGAEEGDILKTGFLGDIRGRFEQIIANHRADPSSIHFSPVALQMQALGADARQLIAADILNQANDTLLNGSGVPVEFYRMTMQTQTAPVALRLIERYWAPLVSGLNELLSFVARRVQFLKKWETAEYTLASVRLVDSIELNQLRVQMAQAGLLSRSRALETVDANFREETRQKLEDMRIESHEQADFQQQEDAFAFSRQMGNLVPGGPMAQAGPGQAQGGQPPQGGDPNAAAAQGGGDPSQGGQPGPGQAPGTPPGSDPLSGVLPQPGQDIDPVELENRAQAAAQILMQYPESVRFGKLQEIKDANPMFHKIVKGHMDEMRSKARSQGQQMVMQQQGMQ